MVITVTLNPSMDKTFEIPRFQPGGVYHKARLIKSVAGGKGINVSRALKLLGGETLALTLLGGCTGRAIAGKLAAEGIDVGSVEIQGESRTCLGIIDPESSVETVLNETGPEVLKSEAARFIRLFKETLRRYGSRPDGGAAPLVVLAGSAPPGFGPDVFKNLAAEIKRRGARAVADLSGDCLRCAVQAAPFMVKINAAELENLTGGRLDTELEIFDAMERIAEAGVKAVVVTRGAKDALAVVRGPKNGIRRWRAQAPRVEAVSAWGSGDCVTAGMVRVLAEAESRLDEAGGRFNEANLDDAVFDDAALDDANFDDAAFDDAVFEKALRTGMASGAANTLSAGAGVIDPRDVKRLFKVIQVTRISRD